MPSASDNTKGRDADALDSSDSTTWSQLKQAISPGLRSQLEIHRRYNEGNPLPPKLHRAVCAELAGMK